MVKKQKIGAIIQARLGSTRLPNKVLLESPVNSKKTILEQVFFRAEKSNIFNQVLVATSTNATDNALADFLTQNNIAFSRGPEDDVLTRFYLAAENHELDIIVRLTADNPCIDPEVIAAAVNFHLFQKSDYTRTTGLPIGMNIEVFSFEPLKKAHQQATAKHDREHVTSFFYTNPEKFKIHYLPYHFQQEAFSNFRLTVDYASDYALVNLIFDNFGYDSIFTIKELYDFWSANPWLPEINQFNFQKRIYQNEQEELTDAVKVLKFYNFENTVNLLTSRIEK